MFQINFPNSEIKKEIDLKSSGERHYVLHWKRIYIRWKSLENGSIFFLMHIQCFKNEEIASKNTKEKLLKMPDKYMCTYL